MQPAPRPCPLTHPASSLSQHGGINLAWHAFGLLAMPGLLSVVVPFFNEEEIAFDACRELVEQLQQDAQAWELILVDDGSRDATLSELARAIETVPQARILQLSKNFKQTAALQAGIDASRGEFIATLDGDMQNDPKDIRPMLSKLRDENLDLVAGWREHRKDQFLARKLPSRIANWFISLSTGVQSIDLGCGIKLYRASVLRQIRLIGEMHRFIPIWLATVTSPERLCYVSVNHRARTAGQSKYGISRTYRVLVDLLTVIFFLRFSGRPAHFFGAIGLPMFLAGGGVLLWLATLKLFFDQAIGTRPLLTLGVLLMLSGIHLICTGVLAEFVVRNQSSGFKARTYAIRQVIEGGGSKPAQAHH
ncbi:MAG: glycosyltransferase [Betaproteobacteria bacterium]|nr:glycosyltransferase [Betaproteobacteria bacterium]